MTSLALKHKHYFQKTTTKATKLQNFFESCIVYNQKEETIKGAPKFYFKHCLCVIIILFNWSLNKPVISIFSFEKLVFHLSVFSVSSVCSLF